MSLVVSICYPIRDTFPLQLQRGHLNMQATVRDDSSRRDDGTGVKSETTDASLIVRQHLRVDTRLDTCVTVATSRNNVACACHGLDRRFGGLDSWGERRLIERRVTVQIKAIGQHRVKSNQ